MAVGLQPPSWVTIPLLEKRIAETLAENAELRQDSLDKCLLLGRLRKEIKEQEAENELLRQKIYAKGCLIDDMTASSQFEVGDMVRNNLDGEIYKIAVIHNTAAIVQAGGGQQKIVDPVCLCDLEPVEEEPAPVRVGKAGGKVTDHEVFKDDMGLEVDTNEAIGVCWHGLKDLEERITQANITLLEHEERQDALEARVGVLEGRGRTHRKIIIDQTPSGTTASEDLK